MKQGTYLTHLSLFSGIGGIDLAAEWAGFQTIAFCEKDKFCQKVLNKHWPGIPIIEDVKDVTYAKLMGWTQGARESLQPEIQETVGQVAGNIRTESAFMADTPQRENNGRNAGIVAGEAGSGKGIDPSVNVGCEVGITIVSGGFPCQPHSVAGKRKASSDERDLWPEFRRVIGEIKPRWVLAENVPGLFSSDSGRFFGNILADLAALGYSVGWCTYGAVDVGALHRRDRVFIVANAIDGNDRGWRGQSNETDSLQGINRQALCGGLPCGTNSQPRAMAYPTKQGLERHRGECELAQSSGQVKIERSGQMADSGKLQRDRWSDGVGIWQREPLETLQDAREKGRQEDGLPVPESLLGRVANGIPYRVDRLKSLGNAVVPQQIYPVLKAIADIESTYLLAEGER